MGKKVFIPMTDEILFDRPELISSPLCAYSQDIPCLHWMDVELNPTQSTAALVKAKRTEKLVRLNRVWSSPIVNVARPQFQVAAA